MARSLSGSGNIVKASLFKITDGAISEEYPFQFNFGELSTNVSAEYNFLSPPGSFLPTAVYRATGGRSLNFSILVDYTSAPTTAGALPDMAFFESLVTPDVGPSLSSGARWTSPPRVLLVVGYRSWDVVCDSVIFKESMFNRGMTPVRVVIDVSLKTIYVGAEEARNYLQELRDVSSPRVILKGQQ